MKEQLQIDKGKPDDEVVKTEVSSRKYLGCSFIISDKFFIKLISNIGYGSLLTE